MSNIKKTDGAKVKRTTLKLLKQPECLVKAMRQFSGEYAEPQTFSDVAIRDMLIVTAQYDASLSNEEKGKALDTLTNIICKTLQPDDFSLNDSGFCNEVTPDVKDYKNSLISLVIHANLEQTINTLNDLFCSMGFNSCVCIEHQVWYDSNGRCSESDTTCVTPSLRAEPWVEDLKSGLEASLKKDPS